MPSLRHPDGVEIHYEQRGDGPAVVIAAYWSGYPAVFDGLAADLARDHRVVTYDARGTGASTRSGPYEMDTDIADLEAVAATAGGTAVVAAVANGANCATHAGARSPELVSTVVAIGTAPIWLGAFEGSEAMLSSPTVVRAFVEMVGRDYRGAMRNLLTVTNDQMSEEELRERVAFQAEYCPQEAAVGRLMAWIEDDPAADARALGERLTVLRGRAIAGPWLPPDEELDRLLADQLPRAHIEEVAEGAVSRPDLTAAAVRRITGR